jgi:hypothetical protein
MGADYEQGPMGRGGRRTLKPISVDFDIPASDNGLKSRTLVSTLWRRNAPSDGKVEPHWFNMLPQLTKDRMIEMIAAGVQQHGVALHSSTQMNMLRTFNQLPITELPITGKQIYELHNYYTSPASGLDDIAFIDLSGKNVSNEHGREMQECQKVDRCACFEVLEEIPALLAVRDYRRLRELLIRPLASASSCSHALFHLLLACFPFRARSIAQPPHARGTASRTSKNRRGACTTSWMGRWGEASFPKLPTCHVCPPQRLS